MNNIKYTLFVTLIILTSCRKEVNQKLTATEIELVVNSFISPADDSIRVQLDYSRGYFNENSDRNQLVTTIGLATVIINDGVSDKRLVWSQNLRHFHISKNELPIVANRKYTLKVSTAEGKNVTAETTVPTPITEFDLVITNSYTQGSDKYNRVNMSLKDEKGVENYYRFVLYDWFKNTNPALANRDQFSELELKFFNDNKDQTNDVFLVTDVRVPRPFGSGAAPVEFFIRGYFEKGDEAYYQYLSKIKQYLDASGNPFAEPTTVFTNINGGLGVFASYQRVEKSIRNN